MTEALLTDDQINDAANNVANRIVNRLRDIGAIPKPLPLLELRIIQTRVATAMSNAVARENDL